jgi:hypothetical protein
MEEEAGPETNRHPDQIKEHRRRAQRNQNNAGHGLLDNPENAMI